MGEPLGMSDSDVRDALDPIAAIGRRVGIGGAAPEAVERLIQERQRALRRQRRWIAARQQAIGLAEAALLARARDAATG
jgi:hypothetical protein